MSWIVAVVGAAVLVVAGTMLARGRASSPRSARPPAARGPSMAEVGERSQQRLARMRELRLDRAAAGSPDSRAATQHEIDRIIADTRADLDALPESSVRLRRMVALVLAELREVAEGP